MKRKRGERFAKAAGRAPASIRIIVVSEWTGKRQRAYQDRRFGKLGPAGPCRVLVKNGYPVEGCR